MRLDSDLGAWILHWSSLCSWYTGISNSVGLFNMRFVRHHKNVDYPRNLRVLLEHMKYGGILRGSNFCCLPKPYAMFYSVKDAYDQWHELDLIRCKPVNGCGPRIGK